MKATVEDINSVQRKVSVEITPEVVGQSLDSEFTAIQKQAQIQGFRVGKAPMAMVKKFFKERAQARVFQNLVDKHLFDAFEQNSLKVVGSPILDNIDNLPSYGESFKFSALVDIMPVITVPDFTKESATIPKAKSSDESVKEEIQRLQKAHAKEKTAEPGTACQNSMKAKISSTISVDGQELPELTTASFDVSVGDKNVFPQIEEALVGMKIGDSKTVKISFDKTHPDARLAGKDADIKFTLNELFERVLPGLDDEFAKDLELENFEALKADVSKKVEAMSARNRNSKIEEAVFNKVNEICTFEVPPSLVDRVIDEDISREARSNQDRDAMLKDEELRKTMRESAKKRGRFNLVMLEFIRKEELKVEDSDVDSYLETSLGLKKDESKELFEQYRKYLTEKGNSDSVLFYKAIQLIASRMNIVEK